MAPSASPPGPYSGPHSTRPPKAGKYYKETAGGKREVALARGMGHGERGVISLQSIESGACVAAFLGLQPSAR